MFFLEQLLGRGEYYDKGVLAKGSTGALSGCALTVFFENIYLLDVDQVLSRRSSYYCRFADDIVAFVEAEDKAREAMDTLGIMITEKGLAFNTSKTAITAPGESFELLGFRIENGDYDISNHSLGKIERKLRLRAGSLVRAERLSKLSSQEAMQKMIRRIDQYFFGSRRGSSELNWVDWSFRILTRPDSLRRLDAVSQDCIRIVGSGGKKTNAKYRVRYAQMRKMGYRTLVHAYYHGFERGEQA